jgi:hypothetical protein
MLLRLLVYSALGVDAVIRREFLAAVLCFSVPFAGPIGMWIATLAILVFLIQRSYIESAGSIGLVILNMGRGAS